MNAVILDGKAAAAQVREELRSRLTALAERSVTPCLRVLLIGEHPDSVVYVRNKERAARALGITVQVERRPPGVSEADLFGLLASWNADPEVHGIIVQMPLPSRLDRARLVSSIAPQKDIDCLHPENVGLLALGEPRFLPPTPAGVLELLRRNDVAVSGKHVVIVGRGTLVGKPLALLLVRNIPEANATVTICHRGTKNLPGITRTADILVSAAGTPRLITDAHVRPGAVVVDVGLTKTPDGWVGDVEQETVRRVASALTPVPGGVGPMTVAMVLTNVVEAAERS